MIFDHIKPKENSSPTDYYYNAEKNYLSCKMVCKFWLYTENMVFCDTVSLLLNEEELFDNLLDVKMQSFERKVVDITLNINQVTVARSFNDIQVNNFNRLVGGCLNMIALRFNHPEVEAYLVSLILTPLPGLNIEEININGINEGSREMKQSFLNLQLIYQNKIKTMTLGFWERELTSVEELGTYIAQFPKF